jgi:hypothetical protein
MPEPNATPSPGVSLIWFFTITTIYFLLRYNTTGAVERNIYTGVYLLLLVIGQYFINLSLTQTMCGQRQWSTALNLTLVPWTMIFGVLNIFLYLFPDWLTPFANTFGYGVAKLMGVNDLLEEILVNTKAQAERLGKQADPNISKEQYDALDRIYTDKSLIINEIKDSKSFFEKMKPLINPDLLKNDALRESKLEQLMGFVNLKTDIALYVWYMLAGSLVTSVTYNYIVSMTCNFSVKDMQKRQLSMTEDDRKKEDERRELEKQRKYTTTE